MSAELDEIKKRIADLGYLVIEGDKPQIVKVMPDGSRKRVIFEWTPIGPGEFIPLSHVGGTDFLTMIYNELKALNKE